MGQDGSESGEGNESEESPHQLATSTDFDIDPAVLDLNHVFSALGHPRRRYLMYALVENPQWTLTELATKLAAWEDDCHEDDVKSHRRDEISISLYHSHVPKLVDEGVVEYDPDEETIAQSTHTEQVLNALAGAGGSLDLAQEQHAERSYDETEDGS